MKVLVIFAVMSATIAGIFAEPASTNAIAWDLIQTTLNETVDFIHTGMDNVVKAATAVNPEVGRLIAATLKTSLDTTIDPLLTTLVDAAMNEVLTKEVIEAQGEALKQLLSAAYHKLLVPMIPLPDETVDVIYNTFERLIGLVDTQVGDIVGFLNG